MAAQVFGRGFHVVMRKRAFSLMMFSAIRENRLFQQNWPIADIVHGCSDVWVKVKLLSSSLFHHMQATLDYDYFSLRFQLSKSVCYSCIPGLV